jgi:hypothetical protein
MTETIEQEVKNAVEKVANEAKSLEQSVVAEVKKAKVEVSTEESLFLRTTEATFLRAQVQIRDKQRELENLAKEAETASKAYNTKVESLITKYGLDKAEYLWDNLENIFRATKKA